MYVFFILVIQEKLEQRKIPYPQTAYIQLIVILQNGRNICEQSGRKRHHHY